MIRKCFSLVEVLVAIGMLTLFLNGIIILSKQILSAHKQHQVSAARLVTEDLLAQRWRQFIRNCEVSSEMTVNRRTLKSSEYEAHIDTDGIWLDGVLTPLPKGLTATFVQDSDDPALLVLTLADDKSQSLRIVARQPNGDSK